MRAALSLTFLMLSWSAGAQTDTTEEEYDFDKLEYAGAQTKTYANPKIFGLSPQRFVSVAYDYQLPYDMEFSSIGIYGVDEDPPKPERNRAQQTGGVRIGVMVPVISSNRFLWQTAANFWQTAYTLDSSSPFDSSQAGLGRILEEKGLRNLNWMNTFYIPLNDRQFVLFQGQADLSGNYNFSNLQSLNTLRYSAAVLWGKRPHDRKQWAVGMSRTYRVGNMNYIPVLMFNYTSLSRKWGTEILFPARAHLRYTFSSRNLVLFGYEVEGQSYRIGELSTKNRSLEIRRGELRFRFDYQFQITGFFWAGIQAGMRLNYSYDADFLSDSKEFFRGFFGEQSFAMKNTLGHTPYFQVSLNFVSP
jgi:hypothetical protein